MSARPGAIVALAVGAATAGSVVQAGVPVLAVDQTNPTCALERPAIAYHAGAPGLPAGREPVLIPCRYDVGAVAMEPSFVFASDGRILYQTWGVRDGAVGGLPPITGVIRSNGDQTRWEDVSPAGVDVHPTSLDPYIYADERTGRIFTVDFAATGAPLCSSISFSDDAGDHWITSRIACGGFDGESIGAGPPVSSPTVGYPDIVYYCTGTTLGSGPPTTTPLCSKSLDGGLTFAPTGSPPYPVIGQQDVFAPWSGNPVVGPDGTVYVPKRFNGQPEIAISHDEGLTWTQVVVAHNGASGEATRAAVDVQGGLYYTWTGDDHLPYVAFSRDHGITWSRALRLSPQGLREAALPRVAVDHPGKVAVVYLGSTNSPGHPPWYADCNVFLSQCDDGPYAGSTWNGYLSQIDDLFAAEPTVRTATVNDPRQPLFTGGCSADGACKAELDFLDVHFDSAGTAWGAFVDDCQLRRHIVPVFNAGAGICEDGVGEGILSRLMPASVVSGTGVPARPEPASITPGVQAGTAIPNTSSSSMSATGGATVLLVLAIPMLRWGRRGRPQSSKPSQGPLAAATAHDECDQ